MQVNSPTQAPQPLYSQRAQQDVFVPMPPLNAGTFAAAVAVTSFLAMVTVLA